MLINQRNALMSGKRNFWKWPKDWADVSTLPSINPNTIWTPDVNGWYGSFIVSGYLQKNTYRGTFTSNSVTSTSASNGYGIARFLNLPAGKYRVRYDCTNASEFRFSFYKQVEGGYKNDGYANYGGIPAGTNWKDITIQDGYMLGMVFYAYGSICTFTNVSITKI